MKTEVILGPAGSGKSYLLQQRIAADPSYALLSSTTGVSAINLGPDVTTINSVLKFFDTASLEEAAKDGRLARAVKAFCKLGYRNLVIDEMSMLGGRKLSVILQAWREVEEDFDGDMPGLVLTGDFLQLPPINESFAFEAPEWGGHLEPNTTSLTTMHRQSDPAFLAALSAARKGLGVTAAKGLLDLHVPFVPAPDGNFGGTTLFATNVQVDKYNRERYGPLPGAEFTVSSARWGALRSEWSSIPESLVLKEGALVMCLANAPGGTLAYANGSLGTVLCQTEAGTVEVLLQKKTALDSGYVCVQKVTRFAAVESEPENAIQYTGPPKPDPSFIPRAGMKAAWAEFFDYLLSYIPMCLSRRSAFFDPLSNRWVVGWVNYMPLRLGYALTTHKAQGLTLDRVQIDSRPLPAGRPALMYVALTRCRTPDGLQIAGSPGRFAERINTAKEVRPWI